MTMDFEVGMKVVIHNGWAGESIGEVAEITKGGNVRVGNTLYNKHGRLRGGDAWCRNRIYPATWEDIERIEKQDIIAKCKARMQKQISKETMDYELAAKLLNVFEEWEGVKHEKTEEN